MAGVLVLLLLSLPGETAGSAADATGPQPAVGGGFREAVTPLVPRRPRTELEHGKVTAAGLYAHGRLLLRRDDQAGALRRFQRAWRYAPEADALLPQIVFLAYQLGRSDEAARYAVLAAERTRVSPALLQQLALQLSRQQDWERAIALLEKSLQETDEAEGEGPTDASAGLGATVARLELGRLCFLTGDFEQSANHFLHVYRVLEDARQLADAPQLEKVLQSQPDRTYRMLAESFFQAGRYEEARTMLLKARPAGSKKLDEQGAEPARNEPGGDATDYYLARIAARQDAREQALEHLNAYFASGSSAAGTEPYELLDELLRDAGPHDATPADQQLAARVDDLLQRDARNPSLLWYAAQRDLRKQRYERAEQRLQQLLVLDGGVTAYEGLIEIYRQRQLPQKLLGVFDLAAARGADLRDFQKLLSRPAEEPKTLRELVKLAGDSLNAETERVGAGRLLAGALLAQQIADTETANRLFAAAVTRLAPTARFDWRVDWGLELLLDERFEAAADVFQEALTDPPNENRHVACQFYLVRALALAGRTDEALEAAHRAARAYPDQPRMQAQSGWVLYHAHRYARAEEAYRNLLQQFDSDHSAPVRSVMREARLILSSICAQQERLPEAEEWLEQVLDEFPEDAGARNDLGYLWADQGKWLQRALTMIEHAVAADPDNAAYRDSLGWVLFRLGRYAQAVAELEQATSGKGPDGVILEHLGDAYAAAGRNAEAIDAYRRALKAFSDDGDRIKRKTVRQKIKTCGK